MLISQRWGGWQRGERSDCLCVAVSKGPMTRHNSCSLWQLPETVSFWLTGRGSNNSKKSVISQVSELETGKIHRRSNVRMFSKKPVSFWLLIPFPYFSEALLSSQRIFKTGKIHLNGTKFTLATVFSCTIQGLQVHCCVNITTIHPQNFFPLVKQKLSPLRPPRHAPQPGPHFVCVWHLLWALHMSGIR